jgi:DNA-binding CsgD family transcriptional regulator
MPETNDLSQREREILNLVAKGASNKEIAQDLHISTNTVKVHLRNIFAKVGANSRTEAAMYAVSSGLIDVGQNGGAEDEILNQSVSSELSSTHAAIGVESRRNYWFLLAAIALVIVIGTIVGVVLQINGSAPTASADQAIIPEIPRWQEKAALNLSRKGLALAAHQNSIIAIGGESPSGVSGKVEHYDPDTDSWLEMSSKPLPVSDIGAAMIGGLVYVPGGELSSEEVTNVLEIFDPELDEWSQGALLPSALSAYALAAFEGKLYLFGGWDGEKAVDKVYIYDPDLGSWSPGTPMPTPRAFPGVGISDGSIYIVGGFDGEVALDTNEIYQPNAEGGEGSPWVAGEALPQPRYAMGVASLAETLHIFGGVGEDGSSLPSLEYATTSGSWETYQTPFEGQWSHLGIVPVGTHLYLVGGEIDGKPTASNLTYQAIYLINLPVVR